VSEPEVDVSIIVVTFHSAQVLAGLIASLGEGLEGLTWRLVVADNASSDDTLGVLRAHAPDAVVVETGSNAGYAAGINAALSEAPQARAYLVLNPDVRLTRGSIATLLRELDRDGVGIAVPRLLGARGELIESQRREPSVLRTLADALVGARRAGRWGSLGEVVSDPAAYERAGTTDWAEGSTQLISRICLERCGPWDEGYFLYSEETDFHLRARDAGLSVRYVPDAVAIHLEGDSATSPRLWALVVANRLRFYRSRHSPPAAAVFWAVLLLREGSRAALGRGPSQTAFRVLRSPSLLRAQRGPDWLERVG
jgi:N-acetylglucosaminyl-diphospho-decaprenol L-rhamnosyltransferase